MRKLCFFCDSIETESVLDPVESNHLCRVLRAQPGTPVQIVDGKGTLAEGTVAQVDKKKAVIRVQKIEHLPPPTAGRVILAVSFAKGQRFDWLIEKCTELGADHIAAVQFERTVKRGRETALERYRKISITAMKQSGRLFLPKITGPSKFPETLDSLRHEYPQNILLYGETEGSSPLDLSAVRNEQDCIIVIGPEGGLSDHERTFLAANRAIGVSINRNILRIETAAVAFCSAICSKRL